MGNIPPDPPAEIDDVKWYAVYTDRFNSDPIYNPGCDALFLGNQCCCILGSALKEKLARGDECKHGSGICHYLNAQRITAIIGPYNSQVRCLIDEPCGF